MLVYQHKITVSQNSSRYREFFLYPLLARRRWQYKVDITAALNTATEVVLSSIIKVEKYF